METEENLFCFGYKLLKCGRILWKMQGKAVEKDMIVEYRPENPYFDCVLSYAHKILWLEDKMRIKIF